MFVNSPDDSHLPNLSAQQTLTNISEKSPPEFALFPKLPTELRLKIWGYTLPGPRLITLHYAKFSACRSETKPPVTLQICRESRAQAQSFYKLTFGTYGDSASAQPTIWFDSAVDIVYLTFYLSSEPFYSSSSLLKIFLQNVQGLDEVRYVAFELSYLKRLGPATGKSVSSFEKFARLEKAFVLDVTGESAGLEYNPDAVLVECEVDTENESRATFLNETRELTGRDWIMARMVKE